MPLLHSGRPEYWHWTGHRSGHKPATTAGNTASAAAATRDVDSNVNLTSEEAKVNDRSRHAGRSAA
jgi:hypothetical protein